MLAVMCTIAPLGLFASRQRVTMSWHTKPVSAPLRHCFVRPRQRLLAAPQTKCDHGREDTTSHCCDCNLPLGGLWPFAIDRRRTPMMAPHSGGRSPNVT